MRVLYWGTPEFAVPPLRALAEEGHEIVAVVTQPDRPRGRHHHTLVPPPVKVVALEDDILVLQPERARDPGFLERLRSLEPEISIVAAYGQILSREAIELPPLGTLNIHASLLPRWRGASPIQAAILAGDEVTGISIMRMVERLDAGPVLLQLRTPIDDGETAGELEVRLAELGAEAIVEALTMIALGTAQETPQDESAATYAPRIDRRAARLEWTRAATDIARAIRAFDPRPGAFTTSRGIEVKLFGARSGPPGAAGDPGQVLAVDEDGLVVACGEGAVKIAYVQPAGKRRMAAFDWYQGRGVRLGEILGS
ncbi:MAG TPA: methionyl-tRNA formyltransferase [Gemmatimonadaceae bacterium]|nr:methionyl-tRNA formyltransferase [Gemmatimonadaceae bacterium]